MKALTVSQPYASLIASGEKWVENRSWGTPYRGPLAIHAGKGTQYMDREQLAAWPTARVVAVCELAACMPLASLQRLAPGCPIAPARKTVGEILAHGHTEGPWCWVLVDVQKLDPPIPCAGKVGLWDWDEEGLAEVRRIRK